MVIGSCSLGGMFMLMACLISPFLGGVGAWVVSLFFTSPFTFLEHMTGMELTPWQWGASLGFVGQFFRSNNYVKI